MEEMSGRSVKMAGRIVISSVMRRGNSPGSAAPDSKGEKTEKDR